jgi:hypothetical protein
MNQQQDGFSAIETVLIFVALGLTAFVGWFVWQSNQQVSRTLYTSPKTNQGSRSKTSDHGHIYTDPSGFTLKYPTDWRYIAKGMKVGSKEYGQSEFVAQKEFIAGNNAYSLFLATDKSSGSAEQYAAARYAADPSIVISSSTSTTNGYDTQTVEHKTLSGNPGVFSVFIVHKGKVVELQYYTSVGDKPYIDTYRAIISSIKFQD